MQPSPPPAAPSSDDGTVPPSRTPQPHDENTRHLAAAVHLNPDLADRVVDNYVLAPTEALPPSPGVNAHTVLFQALVARHRRRVRDALVLALMLVAALSVLPYSTGFALFWGAVWLVWYFAFGLRRAMSGRHREVRDDEDGVSLSGMVATALFLCWLLGWFLSVGAAFSLFGSGSSYGYYSGSGYGYDTGSPAWLLVSATFFVLSTAALYFVLLADKTVMRHALAVHGSPAPQPRPSGLAAGLTSWLTSTITRRYGWLLDEVASRAESGNVLVHGGWDAFVGHGERVGAWTFPLVLRARDSESGEVAPLHPQELYQAINTELCTMREADLLAPGRRFREIAVTPLIVVSAEGLRQYRGTPLGRELLSEADGRPVNALWTETLPTLMDQDEEWIRHFQRSSVISWNSDLLVSTLLNIGCDNRTLYLEWNAYCLFPIARRYRRGGHVDTSTARSAGYAALEFVQVLGSIARRARTFVHMGVMWRRGTSSRAGSERHEVESIREIAADVRCDNEFQDLDGQRHITLLAERTFSAVRHHLKERGYDTEGLDEQSTQVISTTMTITGGQFVGAHSWGTNSTADASTTRSGSPTTPKERR